jgi:endo-1,4-beta-xylanase
VEAAATETDGVSGKPSAAAYLIFTVLSFLMKKSRSENHGLIEHKAANKALALTLDQNMKRKAAMRSAVLVVAALGFGVTQTSLGAGPDDLSQSRNEKPLMSGFIKSFAIGAAIPGAELSDAERRLLFRNFSNVTPENCMKPASLHPAEDRFDFAKADALVEMARANGLAVNGHTLIWHRQCPDWFFTDDGQPADRELVLRRMRDHITAAAGRYAGKVMSWDVVNEAIDDGNDYLRKSKWLASIGEDYIAEAFITARKADPKAELYYNDYDIERQPKRDKTLRLIHELKQQGAPLDGIGIQGHWQLDHIPFNDIEEAILAFHSEGLRVMITELDIDVVPPKATGSGAGLREQDGYDPLANGLPDDLQQRLADQYARLFALFLKHQDKITRVTFWGLHDGLSWLNYWPSKRTNHPLLWDRALQPKSALAAVLELTEMKTGPNTQPPPDGAGNSAPQP